MSDVKKFLQTILVTSCVFLLASCGSSSSTSSSSSSSASNSFPSGLAVASPTASGSSSASINANLSDARFATIDSGSTFADKIAVYETIVAAATDEACQITLPTLTASTDPSCYGPALDYQNHPDASGGDPTSGQLPTGDLGIWSSTQGGTEACTAAKINTLIDDTADKFDYVMLMAASMVCLMTRDGTSLPSTDGDSVDMTTDLNTAVQVNNSSVTVSAATVTNLTDITDNDSSSTVRDAYQFALTVSDASGSTTVSTTAYMKHMPTASDNSTFKGRVWAEIEGISSAGDKDAYSIEYNLASATSLIIQMMGANYQLADSSTTIFDSDGGIDVTGDWTGNMSRGILNLDPDTGLGDFSYSWQAGNGDDKARIFNGFTEASSGCGFFGYGDQFNNSTGDLSDNVIDGFICNWAGPGNDHSMSSTSGIAQKQCMTVNSSTSVFEVNSSKNSITYAPTVSCNSSGTLGIKLTTETTYDTTTITNDLVTLSSDSDFSSYSAPSAPSLPTGL